MNETRRVLLSKRTIVPLILIVVVNFYVFIADMTPTQNEFFSQLLCAEDGLSLDEMYMNASDQLSSLEELLASGFNSTSAIDILSERYVATKDAVAYIDYLKSYPAFINDILRKGEQQSQFSFLNQSDTYAKLNIDKTLSDFKKMDTITLTIFPSYAIDSFLQYKLNDFLIVIWLLLVSMSFVEERKNGMWGIVRCSAKGRASLGFQRIGVLLIGSVVIVAALHFIPLLLALTCYGGWENVNIPAQSIRALKMLPLAITLKDFFAMYFIIKYIATIVLALVFTTALLLADDHKVAILVLVAVFTVHYALFSYLPSQSYLALLKYFNLFSYINTSSLLTEYNNVPFWGKPVNIREFIVYSSPLIAFFLMSAVIYVHCSKKPAHSQSFIDIILYHATVIRDKAISHFGLFMFEFYKTMVLQRGFLLLMIVFAIAFVIPFSSPIYRDYEEVRQDEILISIAGQITDDTYRKLTEYRKAAEQIISDNEDAQVRYENNEIKYHEYFALAQKLDSASIELEIVDRSMHFTRALQATLEANGVEAFVLSDYQYRSSLGYRISDTVNFESANRHNNKAMICILGLTLIVSGGIPFDFQSGMRSIISSTINGRKKLLRVKNTVLVLVAVLTWFFAYIPEIFTYFFSGTFTTLSYPVQSLSIFSQFPLHISINTFLILLYAYRCFALISIAFVLNWIASFCRSIQMAQVISLITVVIPSILYCVFEIDAAKYIALAPLINTLCFLIPNDGYLMSIVLPSLLLVLGMAICMHTQRKVSHY